MTRHECLYEQYQVLISEHSHQRDWVLQWQADKHRYEKAFKSMQRAMVTHSMLITILLLTDTYVVERQCFCYGTH